MDNSAPSYAVKLKQTQALWCRDRCRLDADVYYPEGDGPFPVLLMRQPYGRAIASTVVYAHPIWYASHGYIVVIQDVRGRGTSEGEFCLFAHEAEDGYDTVAWAAQLPQSNGRVGMYGFSYQGMTQLYAAATHPPALKALAPAMVGYNLYHDWAYEQGALVLQAGLGWAIQLAAETTRLRGDAGAYRRLYGAARALPLQDDCPVRPDILSELAPDSFFHEWLDHPTPDDYWEALKPDLSAVQLPMLHVGGWFDPYLRGDLRRFLEVSQRQGELQHFWVGPWGHIPWGRRGGSVDFGPAANSPIDALQIRWFDYFLKDIDTGLATEPPVHLFEMGTNQWLSSDRWPQGNPATYRLKSQGLAAMREDDGELVLKTETSVAQPQVSPTQTEATATESADVIVHDPWRPAPSLGGHSGLPAGAFERSAIDCRSDVLVYTTLPLNAFLRVAGTVQVEVCCGADAPSFDLCAVLSEVQPEGRVFNLTQGYCRVDGVEPGHRTTVRLALQPTCFCIPQGHALRLSLSAACYPAYAVNPGTGQQPGASRLMDYRIITLTVYSGAIANSTLTLPLTPEDVAARL